MKRMKVMKTFFGEPPTLFMCFMSFMVLSF
jgi:hypothetical protein